MLGPYSARAYSERNRTTTDGPDSCPTAPLPSPFVTSLIIFRIPSSNQLSLSLSLCPLLLLSRSSNLASLTHYVTHSLPVLGSLLHFAHSLAHQHWLWQLTLAHTHTHTHTHTCDELEREREKEGSFDGLSVSLRARLQSK